jgi:hypothetical protein
VAAYILKSEQVDNSDLSAATCIIHRRKPTAEGAGFLATHTSLWGARVYRERGTDSQKKIVENKKKTCVRREPKCGAKKKKKGQPTTTKKPWQKMTLPYVVKDKQQLRRQWWENERGTRTFSRNTENAKGENGGMRKVKERTVLPCVVCRLRREKEGRRGALRSLAIHCAVRDW